MGNQREVTSNDVDTAVEILSERIDIVASAAGNTNRTISSIERHAKSTAGATNVIMWIVVIMFVLQLVGIAFAMISIMNLENTIKKQADEAIQQTIKLNEFVDRLQNRTR